MRAALQKFGPSLILLAAFLAMCGLYHAAPKAFLALTHGIDGIEDPAPFGDWNAILSAGACWRQGVDVYTPNACMGGGMYNYAPLLLRAADLPIGPQDRVAGGILLDLAFIAALAVLPAPAGRREFLVRAAAALSSTIFWLLGSANFDICVFLMACAGVRLVLARRFAGYLVFILAAALKFYPVALLVLAAREAPVRLLAIAAVAVVCLAADLIVFSGATATALAKLPGAIPFHGVFGAEDMPLGLILLHFLPVPTIDPSYAQYHPALTTHYLVAVVIYFGTRLVGLATLIGAVFTARRYAAAPAALDPVRLAWLASGAAVIVFCYLGAQNLDYRGVFLLLTLPGLWGLGRRWLVTMILLLLWEATLRNLAAHVFGLVLPAGALVELEIAVWLARELLWWWLAVQLGGFLLSYLAFNLSRHRDTARKILKLTATPQPHKFLNNAQRSRPETS